MELQLNIGDSIMVKDGVKDPDFEYLKIEGWQGRVVEILEPDESEEGEEGEYLIAIEWDSITLKHSPRRYFRECFNEGFDCFHMTLSVNDVILVEPRDAQKQVVEIQEEISEWLGEEED